MSFANTPQKDKEHYAVETPSPMLSPKKVTLQSQSSSLPSPGQRPANAKHSRRISRNFRPPHSADGLGLTHSKDLDLDLSRANSYEFTGLGIDDGEKQVASPSKSSVSRNRASSSSMMLSLPIFAESDVIANQGNISRASSMREGTTPNQQDDRNIWDLPSHHKASQRQQRIFPTSASMSILSPQNRNNNRNHSKSHQPTENERAFWSKDAARRWSSSLPRKRDSAALAYRLAEGASPYLRAGLEELKSIFDVDSNPIPSSPFLDEDVVESDEDQHGNGGGDLNTNDCEIPTLNPDMNLRSTEGRHLLTASPMALSSRDLSPTPSGLSNSDVEDSKKDSHPASSPVKSFFSNNVNMPSSLAPPPISFARSNHSRGESFGQPSLSNAAVDRKFLAWSLTIIAIGMTVVCAWGYAMQADTFSVSLIGFFLTQPAFALSALIALLLRKRALMDLFSRAMRAHILAQALTVVLAYLDLSASSLYVVGRGNGSTSARQFQMVPSMEMRFGPMHKASAAGEVAELLPNLDENASMIHAHDSSVGDWRSRITHLVVFLVQAAAPIVMALIGQYIVAQRLALLARSGSLSRQSSLRQDGKLSPINEKNSFTSVPFKPKSHTTLPRLQIVSDADNNDVEIARHRREQKRKRIATLPGTPLLDTQFHDSGHASSEHSPIDRGLVERRHTSAIHRHHRSVSHPVNVCSNDETPPLLTSFGNGSPTASQSRFGGDAIASDINILRGDNAQ